MFSLSAKSFSNGCLTANKRTTKLLSLRNLYCSFNKSHLVPSCLSVPTAAFVSIVFIKPTHLSSSQEPCQLRNADLVIYSTTQSRSLFLSLDIPLGNYSNLGTLTNSILLKNSALGLTIIASISPTFNSSYLLPISPSFTCLILSYLVLSTRPSDYPMA